MSVIFAWDSREQLRYSADEMGDPSIKLERVTLAAGDYSIVGAEDRIAVERKSLADYVMSVTTERERFKRELAKLAEMDAAFVVVEANLGDLDNTDILRSQAHPNSLFGSTVAITVDFVPVLWAGDRLRAARLTYRLLKRLYDKRIAVQTETASPEPLTNGAING